MLLESHPRDDSKPIIVVIYYSTYYLTIQKYLQTYSKRPSVKHPLIWKRKTSLDSAQWDLHDKVCAQWRNDAPGAPATPGGGGCLKGAPNRDKMWDNFARLIARLAKLRALFHNSTIYLDFSAIFSRIVPNRPFNEGRPLGATFCRRGATSWLSLQRYATVCAPRFWNTRFQKGGPYQAISNFRSVGIAGIQYTYDAAWNQAMGNKPSINGQSPW